MKQSNHNEKIRTQYTITYSKNLQHTKRLMYILLWNKEWNRTYHRHSYCLDSSGVYYSKTSRFQHQRTHKWAKLICKSTMKVHRPLVIYCFKGIDIKTVQCLWTRGGGVCKQQFFSSKRIVSDRSKYLRDFQLENWNVQFLKSSSIIREQNAPLKLPRKCFCCI